MPRSVFFSFHYQRDIMRVQVVKNHYVTKGNYTSAGFFDGSLEEKAKKDGDQAVKRLIDNGLIGSSVLCVLIGAETYTRRWVDYEILKAVELGMGVFGIRIHQIADFRNGRNGTDTYGQSPFATLGFGTTGNNLKPMIHYKSGWQDAPYLSPISRSAAPYLPNSGGPVLKDIFSVYDWVDDNGFDNFSAWVERAARQAGH